MTFIDFGDMWGPEEKRRRLHSPLEDVASMLRSFHAAGEVGLASQVAAAPQELERRTGWVRWWVAWSAAAFLNAYRTAAGASLGALDTGSITSLIRLFLLEQTFDEIRLSLRTRSNWLVIPVSRAADVIDALTG